MAEPKNLAELDGSQSVSALGLRWAALRGMLASPLILSEEQRHLREELLRELGNIEQNFVSLQSRNAMEISAKIDIAKSALHEGLQSGQSWLVSLLESIQTDLHATSAKPTANGSVRPPVSISRAYQSRPEANGAPSGDETEAPAA
ncbi:hypothetical protein [Microvirga pudoricolor]|uniref:hypothetical protein n=1 Tax=Microvirga pudoricolor TaxID=2778729 RepID=UPI00194E6E5B|nr:hypothetical protein [Microvirga pudoricolor]MBM6594706.1 hypothetical protein [Microvirga pudoricolor]